MSRCVDWNGVGIRKWPCDYWLISSARNLSSLWLRLHPDAVVVGYVSFPLTYLTKRNLWTRYTIVMSMTMRTLLTW